MPSASEALEPAAKVASAVAFNKALSYAAGQRNVLGGTGLLYPFKSSVFRRFIGVSKAAEDAALPAALVYATADAVLSAGRSAYQGRCQ